MSNADEDAAKKPPSGIKLELCNPEVRRILGNLSIFSVRRDLPASMSERLDRLEKAENHFNRK